VSNAKLDLPEPLGPVNTTNFCFGTTSRSMSRLCSRAPVISMLSPARGAPSGTSVVRPFPRRGSLAFAMPPGHSIAHD
jgi:hypothetical protein